MEKFNLGGFPDERIISIAQKEMAADQRLREAKEAVDQRLPESQDRRSGAGDVNPDQPTDQSDEPRPDDADGLPTEGSPQEDRPVLNEEKLDEIVQRVQFGDAVRTHSRVLPRDSSQMRSGCVRFAEVLSGWLRGFPKRVRLCFATTSRATRKKISDTSGKTREIRERKITCLTK